MKMVLFIYLMISCSFIGCDKRAELSPQVSHFNQAEQLKKLDGKEEFSKELSDYIQKTQNQNRKIASTEHSPPEFSPSSHSKFPLPYFLVPEAMAQFISTQTDDDMILDQLYLRVSGIKNYKFLVHPLREKEFEFMRGFYTYIGTDRTEFYATPTANSNTLVVWNRNNPKRKPFQVILENSEKEGKLDRQIISDLPIKAPDEKHK
jgi:hypothetical protein